MYHLLSWAFYSVHMWLWNQKQIQRKIIDKSASILVWVIVHIENKWSVYNIIRSWVCVLLSCKQKKKNHNIFITSYHILFYDSFCFYNNCPNFYQTYKIHFAGAIFFGLFSTFLFLQIIKRTYILFNTLAFMVFPLYYCHTDNLFCSISISICSSIYLSRSRCCALLLFLFYFSLCRSLSVSCTNHYNDGRRAKRIGPLNHVPNVMLFFPYAIFVFILIFLLYIYDVWNQNSNRFQQPNE